MLHWFADAGAPKSILVDAHPHLGSDNLRKDHDAIPAWVFDKEPDFKAFEQGTVKMDREDWEKSLDMWYEAMGWDKETGIPTRETLHKFDLDDCADKLAELGLLA